MAHNHRYDDTSTIQDYADVDFSTIDPKDWHRYTIRPGYQHDFGNKRGRWRRWDREFPALAIPVDAAALASSIETYATIEPSYKAFLEFAADENSRIGQLPVEVALRIKRLLCHRETADIWYARMACKSGNCDHGHLVPPATNLDEVSHWVNETHLICEDEDGCDGCADHLFRCWEARTRITLQPGRFSRVLAWGNRQWPTKAQGDEWQMTVDGFEDNFDVNVVFTKPYFDEKSIDEYISSLHAPTIGWITVLFSEGLSSSVGGRKASLFG